MDTHSFESKDKQIVPFLLTQRNIKFLGTRSDGPVLFFRFAPFENCRKLANDFISRKAPLVQPKDLLDALEAFRDRVFEMKEKQRNHERPR